MNFNLEEPTMRIAELSRRFSMQDEAEQKAKIDREQANELEYVDESQKSVLHRHSIPHFLCLCDNIYCFFR